MKTIKIYIWSTCPYCHMATDLLKNKGVSFETINLDGKDEELFQLRELTKQRTVPQIFIGDLFIGGFSDLSALDVSGQLDVLLKEH